MACDTTFAGIDLISGVSCKTPYEWVDRTGSGWDFNFGGRSKENLHVSIKCSVRKHEVILAVWRLILFCLLCG